MKSRQHVVLLHGWASHPQVFRGLGRLLEKKFNVLTLPLPGYAETEACVPYTLERIADSMASAAPQQCCVLGWSLGAQVALTWSQRAPRQVRRLALMAATPRFTQQSTDKDAWPHAVAPTVIRQFTSAIQRDLPGVLRRFVALQSLGDVQAVRVAHRLRTALFTHALPPPAVLEAGLELLRVTDLREMLPLVQQQTLVLHGDNDAVTPCAAGVALSGGLPHARFETIAGAGHAPFLTDANAVAELLLTFFDEAAAAV